MIHALEAAIQRPVSRETYSNIEKFHELLLDEARRQNLVSASTLTQAWDRHIIDSAQLARFEPHPEASWVDIGSGAGLPGLVIAMLASGPVTLVEPRRLRAEFLARASAALRLDGRVAVVQAKAERVEGTFDVITARAVAPLSRLLELSAHLSTRNSLWVLPKGRNAAEELAEAKRRWQGTFHVERSVTDADASIVVARGVKAKSK